MTRQPDYQRGGVALVASATENPVDVRLTDAIICGDLGYGNAVSAIFANLIDGFNRDFSRLKLRRMKAFIGSCMIKTVRYRIDQLKVLNPVIKTISISMVDVTSQGYFPVMESPNCAVQSFLVAIRLAVVPAMNRVLVAIKDNKRQNLFLAQRKVSCLENLVHGLAAYPKRCANVLQTEPLLVKGIHCVCPIIFPWSYHVSSPLYSLSAKG